MKQFIRGERAKLAELAAINHIWEVRVALDAPFFIVDYCCLGLDANGDVVDNRFLISYNQPDSPQDAIRMDNRDNNGAVFMVYLEKLPPRIRRLVFTATLHEPEMPGGLVGAAFSLFGIGFDGEVGQGRLTLKTPAREIGEFAFSGENFGKESTLILGEFYLRDEWRFVAAGQVPTGELSTFLRTLTEGPTPFPLPAPQPAPAPIVISTSPTKTAPTKTAPTKTAPTPLSAPPRPPHASAAIVPKFPAPAPISLPAVPSAPIVGPIPMPLKTVTATVSFPQELSPGGRLQDLVDAAQPGSTLTLMRDEYEGPIVIIKPLVLEGRDSALWARNGPVVTVDSIGVTLRNLDLEVTVTYNSSGPAGVALQVETQAQGIHLDNVRVRGRIGGISGEDGDWELPEMIDLGEFAPKVLNEFQFKLRTPIEISLSSPVEGVTVLPNRIGPGEHHVTIQAQGINPETLIVGYVELKSPSLVRNIPLNGSAVTGAIRLKP